MSSRFLGIDLSEGIRPKHMVAYLLVALISSGYAGAMSVLQPALLFIMEIPYEKQSIITGNLSALQEVILIVTFGAFGALADRVGRKKVYLFGLLFTAIGFALYPYAQNVTQLALFRVIVALGSAAMIGMMVTVIADYTRESTRGHANGVQGFIATLGAFIPPLLAVLPAVFVKGGLSELDAQKMTFGVAGAMGVFGFLVAAVGLAPFAKRAGLATKEKFGDILREGASAAKERGVALSYGAAFISRGDLAVTGAFIFLWLVQVGVAKGMTPSEAMGSLAAPRVVVVVMGAMVGALFMGWLADRVRRVTAVAIAAGLASIAYLGMIFVQDPSETWVFALLGLMGFAEISAFVSSQALVGQRAKFERRGTIIGFFGVAGAIGILVGTMGGGFLFAKIAPSAPFALFGVLNFIVFIWALWLKKKEVGHAEPTAASIFS